MAFTLDNRAKLRQAFFRMTNSSDTDQALEEQDTEANEAVHLYIQHGLWKAQEFVLNRVDKWRWLTTSAAISWAGNDEGGGQYWPLPSDFLRLAGRDEETRYSALREANGNQWGVLIDPADRFTRSYTDSYWLQNERLFKVVGAEPPSVLYMDYHHRHALLDDDADTIDFDVDKRPLIVAYAAQIAMVDSWLPGGPEMIAKIEQGVKYWEAQVAQMGRRTQAPRRLKSRQPLNSNRWM